MPLPILSHHPPPTNDDLIRFYHRSALHWARQTAEDEAAIDIGVALLNRTFADAREANYLLDASLPDGTSPADAVRLVDAHFAGAKTRCGKWVMNPSQPTERTAPLADHLLASGFQREAVDIMYLSGRPKKPINEVAGLTIIPARASFRHARQLLAEWIGDRPQKLVDLLMLNLEDPQTDALIALNNGTPAALVAVLPVGDIGCIENIFVSAAFRNRGIGRTMMSRRWRFAPARYSSTCSSRAIRSTCRRSRCIAAQALNASANTRFIMPLKPALKLYREIASPRRGVFSGTFHPLPCRQLSIDRAELIDESREREKLKRLGLGHVGDRPLQRSVLLQIQDATGQISLALRADQQRGVAIFQQLADGVACGRNDRQSARHADRDRQRRDRSRCGHQAWSRTRPAVLQIRSRVPVVALRSESKPLTARDPRDFGSARSPARDPTPAACISGPARAELSRSTSPAHDRPSASTRRQRG